MPRHLKFGIVFLVALSLAGVSDYYNLQKRISDLMKAEREPSQPYLTAQPGFSETAPVRKVTLFFPSSSQDDLLESELREIHSSDVPPIEAKQIVAELIAGSKEGRLPALPADAKLRELFVTGDGLAVVDVTREASSSHPGGLTQEMTSVYALVNSLTQNVKGIERVQILVEGVEVETLAGHIDLTRPFRQDLSRTDKNLVSAKSEF
jgi:spore germination protein GerM